MMRGPETSSMVSPEGREKTKRGSMRSGRLVLGYDGGCAACAGLARRVEEAVGGRLEVMRLSDPRMRRWRERALGSDAPWAPTLVEVGTAGKVKAWTGVRMGIALSKRLGPTTTWRVMQVLGESKAMDRAEIPRPALETGGISRSQFLKGLTGGLFALSVLPAGQALAVEREAVRAFGATRVSANSATIGRLRRFRAVDTVAGEFGSPDWSGVTRAKYKDNDGEERTFFAIPYRSAKMTATGTATGITLLFVEDEASVEDAQSIVLRLRQTSARQAALDYYLPNGTHLATVDAEDGEVRARPAARSSQGSVQPLGVREFVGCFVACLGASVSPSCAIACVNCVIPPPEPPPCIQCAACAGPAGLRCARLCRPFL